MARRFAARLALAACLAFVACLALAALAPLPAVALAAAAPSSPAAPSASSAGAAPSAAAAPSAGAGQEEPRFGDAIAVRLVTVVARVVDGAGEPVLGLSPADFRVKVGRRDVAVAAVDWMASAPEPALTAGATPAARVPSASPAPPPPPSREPPASPPLLPPPSSSLSPSPPPLSPPPEGPRGKLVVIFVQADNNSPNRVRGHLHTLPFTRELLAALDPADRVAVVSFDSHLKLWQDFTREREPVPQTIYRAIHFGGVPAALTGTHAPAATDTPAATAAPAGASAMAAPAEPSLAGHFDAAAALAAASPERALAVTAAALAALPGEKVVVFLAWGLGDFSPMGTRMTPAFAPAARALAAARASVFVLDVTEADSHSLEVGLRGIAEATGGTYDKTNLFPALAIRQLARTVSGYYVLSLDAAALPAAGGAVEIELRARRGATVLLRPTVFPAAAGTSAR